MVSEFHGLINAAGLCGAVHRKILESDPWVDMETLKGGEIIPGGHKRIF